MYCNELRTDPLPGHERGKNYFAQSHEPADCPYAALISSLPSARHKHKISPGWFFVFLFSFDLLSSHSLISDVSRSYLGSFSPPPRSSFLIAPFPAFCPLVPPPSSSLSPSQRERETGQGKQVMIILHLRGSWRVIHCFSGISTKNNAFRMLSGYRRCCTVFYFYLTRTCPVF